MKEFVCRKYLYMVFLLLSLFLWILFPVCVNASNRNDISYYGDYVHNFKYYTSTGVYDNFWDNETNLFLFCTNMNTSNPNFCYVMFRFADDGNLSFGYKENPDGTFTYSRFKYGSPYTSSGGNTYYYSLVNIVNIGSGLNSSDVNASIIYDLPLFQGQNIHDCIDKYISGVNEWYNDKKGGEINADVSVDTSNIENLLSTNNQYNQSSSDDISFIKDKIEEGMIFDNGFSESDSKNIESLKTFLILCCMIHFAQYIRNVLAQWLRNVRVK